jgi:predicted metal-dependent peptidase
VLPGWFQSLLRRLSPAAAPVVPSVPEGRLGEGWFDRWLRETGFLSKYPAYAGVIARFDPVATRSVPTMAVALRRWDDPGAHIHLLVNREYFDEHPEHRAGILLHEIQHVMLGHLSRPELHAVQHPRLMELAMEVSANEDIEEPLPEALDIAMFADLGLEERQSTRERYACLVKAYEEGKLCLMDVWWSRMLDVHRPRRLGASEGAGIGDFLDARSDRATSQNWNRAFGLGRPTDAATLASMKKAILKHLGGERGGAVELLDADRPRLAKEMDRFVIQSDAGARLAWRRVLRQAFPRRRLVHPDYLRPNRRFPSRIGEVPGRTRRPPRPALLVAIDTSGSMSVDTLSQVADEIVHLSRVAKLTVVECDAAVHRTYPLTRALGPFVGGGDTDFGPVFEEARRGRFDGVVYFTDGKGAMPVVLPALPALWAITHEDPFEAPFGSVIRLPVD